MKKILVFLFSLSIFLPLSTSAEGLLFHYRPTWAVAVPQNSRPFMFGFNTYRTNLDNTIQYKFLFQETDPNRVEPIYFRMYRQDWGAPLCFPEDAAILGCIPIDPCNARDPHDPNRSTNLVASITIPVLELGKSFSHEGIIHITVANGFRINLQPESTNIFYRFETMQGEFLQQNNNGSLCGGDAPITVDDPQVQKPDLVIQNIVFPQFPVVLNNRAFTVDFDIVNQGQAATNQTTIVCLDKRNVAPGLLVGDSNFRICNTNIPQLASGQSYHVQMKINPVYTNFFNWMEELILPINHPNRSIQPGMNRLGLILNPYFLISESNYDNNEEVFFMNALQQ